MYFADFLSQPDHSMATILGIRDYGVGNLKNGVWGFEWTNLMITYSSRHRITGPGTWYQRELYDYSSYKGRRWGSHSGSDSDDTFWGMANAKLVVVPIRRIDSGDTPNDRASTPSTEIFKPLG